MKLTDHFSTDEFLVSSSYPDIAKRMRLSLTQKNRLFILSILSLERIRKEFGTTRITSGFRSTELNTALSGAPGGQHTKAEAVDIICPYAVSMGLVYRFILDQLEWPGEVIYYRSRGHIHIALPSLTVHPDHFINEK